MAHPTRDPLHPLERGSRLPHPDERTPMERRQDEIDAEREAGEWQDHWDAIRKGECDDPDAAGAMRAPGYGDWED